MQLEFNVEGKFLAWDKWNGIKLGQKVEWIGIE